MKYGFSIYRTNVEGHVFWIAESKDLKGCVGQGDTIEYANREGISLNQCINNSIITINADDSTLHSSNCDLE